MSVQHRFVMLDSMAKSNTKRRSRKRGHKQTHVAPCPGARSCFHLAEIRDRVCGFVDIRGAGRLLATAKGLFDDRQLKVAVACAPLRLAFGCVPSSHFGLQVYKTAARQRVVTLLLEPCPCLDWAARGRVVKYLGDLAAPGDKKVLAFLVRTLRWNDRDPLQQEDNDIARRRSAAALMKVSERGDEDAVAALKRSLVDDEDPLVRCAAAHVYPRLSFPGDEEATGAMRKALRDNDHRVRGETALSVWRVSAASATEAALREMSVSDDNPLVRDCALRGLKLVQQNRHPVEE